HLDVNRHLRMASSSVRMSARPVSYSPTGRVLEYATNLGLSKYNRINTFNVLVEEI
ncbi:2721_t:CDS:1, partial [Acaulospora colombiana]